ncbi:helix-turn-helix domain-containing protein [Croceitalea marina]|uniref:Helix-turn-helix domain-containing protein n=1 Tax=Croceitalea marina TaxID=1775166 RepID=A0ABW5N267_9FLAO
MNVNQLIIWIVITLAAIFLLALISLPGKNYGKKLLIIFVLNFVLHFLNIYFLEFSQVSIPINLNPFFSLNYGPTLWLYFINFKGNTNSTNKKSILYFFPAFLFLIWGSFNDFTFNEITVITILILLYNIGFIISCIAYYFKNENIFSLSERKWLLSLVGIFGVLLITVGANLFFSIAEKSTYHNKATTLIFILAAFLIGTLVYFSIIAPEVFKNFKAKYLGSGLNKKESLILSKEITSYLLDNERFVDSNITLEKLSNELNFSQKKISQAINQHLGNNFYDYLNFLRVRKAQNMFLDSKSSKMAIKNVMYDCGFNNKVTFNKAFKERIGFTPTEFRKIKR